MTELSSYMFEYGLPLIFLIPFLSCLAVPVPASALFMLAGTMAASGDFSLPTLFLLGICGAVMGDQTGYFISRHFATYVESWSRRHRAVEAGLQRASRFTGKWGGLSVFLSRWLASPLGPYVNISSGLTGYAWSKFLAWSIAGEIIWVSMYLGIGYVFSTQAQAIADMIGNAVWLIIAAAITIWLGRKVFASHPH